MTKTSQSGYEITIKAFIPCDPQDHVSMADASQIIADLEKHGIRVLHSDGFRPLAAGIHKVQWRARSKQTPPQQTGARAADPAEPGPPTAPQEQAGDGASSPPSPADDMPGFLRRT